MKVSKQFSIVLAASVLAFGVATLVPQQADASYGYKYTDSQRPPVSTPTGYVNPAMCSTVTAPKVSTAAAKTIENCFDTFIKNLQITQKYYIKNYDNGDLL